MCQIKEKPPFRTVFHLSMPCHHAYIIFNLKTLSIVVEVTGIEPAVHDGKAWTLRQQAPPRYSICLSVTRKILINVRLRIIKNILSFLYFFLV